jgi:hypothetical protein
MTQTPDIQSKAMSYYEQPLKGAYRFIIKVGSWSSKRENGFSSDPALFLVEK